MVSPCVVTITILSLQQNCTHSALCPGMPSAQPSLVSVAAVEVRDFWCDPPVDSVDCGTRDTRRSSRHHTGSVKEIDTTY